MGIVDFTARMKEMERPKRDPIFTKIDRDDVLPNLRVSVYQSPDSEDIYYATREACLMVGYSANWLHTALQRESTRNELIRLGMEHPLTEIRVKIGRIKKMVMVLTRSDFMALIEYGKDAGNKDAIALYRTFQVLGLHKAAGIESTGSQVGDIYRALGENQDVSE